VVEDYRSIHLSLKAHPCAFFRTALNGRGVVQNIRLRDTTTQSGRKVSVAGLVLIRQRPGTAKGVTFLTVEDETGIANIIVWPKVFERERRTVMTASLLVVHGHVERQGDVIHVVAERLEDWSEKRLKLETDASIASPKSRELDFVRSRDFH
jgi:error-prone DNA polymerase